MGDWRVLKTWTAFKGYRECLVSAKDLLGAGYPIAVDQHQDDPVVPDPAPEFDIEIRYWTTWSGQDHGRFKTGWRYVLQWVPPEGERHAGYSQIESNYGYPTPDLAKTAAEYRATQIAQALAPVEKYKFTPEV